VETLRLLAPHIRRALEISRTMFGNSIEAIAAQKFSAIPPGGALLALTATRQVIYANEAAHGLAEAGAVLRYSTLGRLHFTEPGLDAALQQALDGMWLRKVTPSASLQLRLPDGGTAMVRLARIESDRLTAMPLGMASGIGEPHLLVSLGAPAAAAESDQMLRRSFGLTQSESRVAGLVAEGLSPREIAEARHVSIHTVRDQIKSVLGKTGLHRQAELARLLHELRAGGGDG
jgi:DNA-binding CsgD family transcriptional regulator